MDIKFLKVDEIYTYDMLGDSTHIKDVVYLGKFKHITCGGYKMVERHMFKDKNGIGSYPLNRLGISRLSIKEKYDYEDIF